MIKDRFNQIYFNGCSFTEGGGFEAKKEHVRAAYKEQYNFEYESHVDVCYPTLVGKQLGIKIINDAKSGSGTDRTIRKVYDYIFKNKLDEVKKTLFILELPDAINRLDVFSNKYNKYLIANTNYDNNRKVESVHPTFNWITEGYIQNELYRDTIASIIKQYSNSCINPTQWEIETAKKYLGLCSFFELHNIEYYVSGNITYFINQIDFNKFIPQFRNNRILKLNINGQIENNIVTLSEKTKTRILDEIGVDVINDGHPGFQAHQLWADGIVRFLNNKYL
jgi:hypothetical protein